MAGKKKKTPEPARRLRKSVHANDALFLVMNRMIAHEIHLFLPVTQDDVKEWFYASIKGSEFLHSNYNTAKGRDVRAFKATESFRKTFFSEDVSFTPEFLSTIVSKFRLHGPYENWEDFCEKIQKHLDKFRTDFNEVYRKNGYEHMSDAHIDGFIPFCYADEVIKNKITSGIVSLKIAGTSYQVVGADPFQTVICAGPALKEIWQDCVRKTIHRKIIPYDLDHLFQLRSDPYYIFLFEQTALRTLIAIPLSDLGYQNLKTWPTQFPDITNDMIWQSDQTKPAGVYIDFVTKAIAVEMLTYFSLTLSDILTFIVKGTVPVWDIPVLILNDVDSNFEIIKKYGFTQLSDERIIGYATPVLTQPINKRQDEIDWTKLAIYTSTLDDMVKCT